MVSTQEQFEQVQAVKKSINTASEAVKKHQALLWLIIYWQLLRRFCGQCPRYGSGQGKISDVMLIVFIWMQGV